MLLQPSIVLAVVLIGGNPHPPFYSKLPWPSGPYVRLTDGSRLAGTIIDGTEMAIRFRTAGQTITIPLERLTECEWIDAPEAWPRERKRDIVRLRTGESLIGDIDGFSVKSLRIKVDGKLRELSLNVLTGIAFNPNLSVTPKRDGTTYDVVLADGSRFTATAMTAGETIAFTTNFGATLRVPKSELVSIITWSDREVPLSELKPSRVSTTPWGTITWPPRMNETALGRELRIGDTIFDRGIGMHAKTEMSFNLAAKWSTFAATVAGSSGTIRVHGDGRELVSRTLSGRPNTLELNVSGVKELTLISDFGDRGDANTDVVWGYARLKK